MEEYGDETISRRYYLDHYNPTIDENGDIIGLNLFLFDITEQKWGNYFFLLALGSATLLFVNFIEKNPILAKNLQSITTLCDADIFR